MTALSPGFPAEACQADDATRARCWLPLVPQPAMSPAGREPASSLEGNGRGEDTLAVAVAARPRPESLRNVRLVVACVDIEQGRPKPLTDITRTVSSNSLIARTFCRRTSDKRGPTDVVSV